ncbi:Unconventional prefoldin RPB5 interactor [Stylophora pistillata]|uniref:Unconventional prefoldin RPB5 interactor n=1 Tax=Stylophora pistillata TaxID=50429 RepID=A0A2B4SUM9_STYPI|nr:Unconventional prefoldin RPB5 interactor [Stylophora pistillata]
MSEFAQISRLKEENKKALLERQQRLLTCERFKEDYEKLEALLNTLPNKTSHEVMIGEIRLNIEGTSIFSALRLLKVPFGSVAFMPGKLVHTNEIMVLLGDNWFAERSGSQALEMVERRKKYLEKDITGIKEDLKNFQSALSFASEIQSVAEENSDVKEIKEELSSQEEERFLTQHSRKAHPKVERLGGAKKVLGLRSDRKEKVTMKAIEVQKVSSEEWSLFARLDELEEKETRNAELDQVGQDDSIDENSTGEHTKIQGDGGKVEKEEREKTNETKKKVTWKMHYVKDETELTVTSPADIYSQFTSKRELKSILRKPSVEEKGKKDFVEDTSVTAQQSPANIVKDKVQTEDFNSQKAFTGSVVEKATVQMIRQESSQLQSSTSQPGKKLSRFKAARQKQQ